MMEELETTFDQLDHEFDQLMEEVAEHRNESAEEDAPARSRVDAETPPPSDGRNGSKRKRTISVRLASVLVVLAVTGTAVALTQNALPAELLELWNTQYQSTDFSLTTFDTRPQSANRIVIDITLTNNDVSTHYANVTVYVLNATGDEILNQTAATGAVAGGGTWVNSFSFNQAGIVNDYEDSLVVVDQSS